MSRLSKDIDSAFQGIGTKGGIEIWCIYNNQLISIPKSSFGKFHSGNAYLVLRTVLRKIESPQYDIHYWLGNDANEVDSNLASDKALELDAALGSCTVQYREVEGQETEKFLSYFKPCIIPVEGKYSPKNGLASETYRVTLLRCKGDHVVRVKEVPFLRSSLNHDDVFILDTASKVFLFAGSKSSIQEKAKALEVVEYIKDNKHDGRCEVATIEDGKFSGDSDAGEFWSFFGGYAPIPKFSSSTVQEQTQTTCAKMFWIDTKGNLHPIGASCLEKDMLEKNKCYMLDCYSEVFVWMGKNTSLTERKTVISSSEELLRKEGRSTSTSLVLLTEGLENGRFRSFFNKWPKTAESSLYNEGREKMAAMFKQKGYDAEELPEEEDEPTFTNSRDTLKVWRVDGDEVSLLSIPDQTKLFSGDCYIVQYKYAYNDGNEYLLYIWIGCESMQQDRADAISHASAIVASTKGESIMCHVYQGNEPARFFPMFQPLVVFKGGLSKRYKMILVENFDDRVEVSSEKEASLFRIQGTSPRNMEAIQVNLTATSLNSSYCYILQCGVSAFTWIGNLSSDSDHDILDRMLYFLDTSWQPMSIREGNEPDAFWDLLGGKSEYPKEKEIRKQIEEPHLFTCSCSSDVLKVKEIYNFVQDDLTTEDILLLDCQSEVYVWIGLNSKMKSQQQALTLGLKFLEMDILEEGLTVRTPVYVVTEGHEPPFFTRFFEWVPKKTKMHGNSFERKLASLKGKNTSTKRSSGSPWKSHSKDNVSPILRSRSVSSNRSEQGSVEDGKSSSNSSLVVKKLFPESHLVDPSDGLERQESSSNSNMSRQNPLGGINPSLSVESLTYSYKELRVDSHEPVTDIDATKREAYLTDEEFDERFGMAKSEFYALPKWKQNKLKISLHLF